MKHRAHRHQPEAFAPVGGQQLGAVEAALARDDKERLDYLNALNAIVEDYDALRGSLDVAAEMHHAERLRDQVVSLLVFEGIRSPEEG
jgi:hypothetical protein